MKRAWLAIASTVFGVVLVGTGVPAAHADGSATTLAFLTEPVDTQVNTAMTSPDGSQTDIRVGAEAGGNVDGTYTGSVTLAFGNNPGKAKFVVDDVAVSTITVTAEQGVADFSPIIVNAVGFRYTLTATADSLTTATSTPFDVGDAAAVCAAGQSCVVGASGPGVSAVVTGVAGAKAAVLTASFGGNVAPLHGCRTTAPGILTFNGDRRKIVSFTVTTQRPLFRFCYGQPKRFVDLSLHKTTFFSKANKEYEGRLAPCIPGLVAPPCISALTFGGGSETVTVKGAAGDPRMSH